MLVVAIGTKNPSKLEGASRALRTLLGSDFQLVPIAVDSGVGRQPIGLETVVRGARNRALQALSKVASADLGLGIEAGLVEVGNTWLDLHVAVFKDRGGRETLGMSPGFPIPRAFVEEIVREGLELDQVADRYFGTHDIGSGEGVISLLTRRALKRQELVFYAVASALIPWLNRDLYGL